MYKDQFVVLKQNWLDADQKLHNFLKTIDPAKCDHFLTANAEWTNDYDSGWCADATISVTCSICKKILKTKVVSVTGLDQAMNYAIKEKDELENILHSKSIYPH